MTNWLPDWLFSWCNYVVWSIFRLLMLAVKLAVFIVSAFTATAVFGAAAVRKTMEFVHSRVVSSGLDAQFIEERFDPARDAIEVILAYGAILNTLIPIYVLLGMLGVAVSLKLAIIVVRWLLSFIPFVATG